MTVFGSPPLTRSAIVRWQEATDPQSPEGGSQRACHTEGAHPTASGRLAQRWRCLKQSYPALAVRKLSLWVASAGELSQHPFPPDRFLGRRPSVTLFQRGCLHLLREVVNAPHHCLVTVSVAMHTSQLGLRIQGLPLPGHHQLTRHVSYVCGGVVDGN